MPGTFKPSVTFDIWCHRTCYSQFDTLSLYNCNGRHLQWMKRMFLLQTSCFPTRNDSRCLSLSRPCCTWDNNDHPLLVPALQSVTGPAHLVLPPRVQPISTRRRVVGSLSSSLSSSYPPNPTHIFRSRIMGRLRRAAASQGLPVTNWQVVGRDNWFLHAKFKTNTSDMDRRERRRNLLNFHFLEDRKPGGRDLQKWEELTGIVH